MDLRQLKYFVAIVEQGTFSKAAATLNIAQPALSLHVRNMEADLGTPLLSRTRQGVLPTEAGEILLRNARIIIDQFEVAREEIRGSEAEPSGEVRLGLPGTISEILSVPLIMSARARYPKIKLCIAEAMSGFVLDWIRESRIDLAVLYMAVSDRALTSYAVLAEDLCLLGPTTPLPGHRAAEGETLGLGEVAALPLILPSGNHGLRKLLEAAAEKRGIVLNTVIEVDSYVSIKELVEHGLGYSILPVNAIRREREAGRLATWPIGKPDLRRSIHLVHQTGRPMTSAVAAIETLTCDTLTELVKTRQWDGAQTLR